MEINKEKEISMKKVIIFTVIVVLSGNLGVYFGLGAILGGALGGLIAFIVLKILDKFEDKK